MIGLQYCTAVYKVHQRVTLLVKHEHSPYKVVSTQDRCDSSCVECRVCWWFQHFSVRLHLFICIETALSISNINAILPTITVSTDCHLWVISSEFLTRYTWAETTVCTWITIWMTSLFFLRQRIVEITLLNTFWIVFLRSQIKSFFTQLTS